MGKTARRGIRPSRSVGAQEERQERQKPPNLPGYRILRAFGQDACGPVWLVRREVDTALGVYKPWVHAREKEFLRGIDHERFIRLLPGAQPREGAIFEVAEGGSLGQTLEGGKPLNVAQVIFVLREIVQALAYLKQRDLRHGNLHPKNILLDAQGHVKIADLGAGIRDAGNVPARLTHGFSDPQVAGDCSDDLYSLGAIAWFLLTAQLPPQGKNRSRLSDQAHLPQALAVMIDASLKTERRQRPRLEEWRQELGSFSGAQKPHIGPGAFPESLRYVTPQSPGPAGLPQNILEAESIRAKFRGGRKTAFSRRWAFVTVASLLLGGGLFAGAALAYPRNPEPTPQGTVQKAPEKTKKTTVKDAPVSAEDGLRLLVQRRALALQRGDLSLLLAQSAPGTQARSLEEKYSNTLGKETALRGLTIKMQIEAELPAGKGMAKERTFLVTLNYSSYNVGTQRYPSVSERCRLRIRPAGNGWIFSRIEGI